MPQAWSKGLETVKVAYIMNSYPMTSTTFIRREISALERQGIDIVRVALRPWTGELVDDDDKIERTRTRYVLFDGPIPLLWAVFRMLLSRPRRFVRAFALACRMGWHADRPMLVHLVYLAEASRIEPWLRQNEIQHVHSHFGTNAAEVAMLVHMLGGPEWSFTVHGPEEFDKGPLTGLAEKVRRCAFAVAVSSYCRSQLYARSDYVYWPKIQVVHCGLDKELLELPNELRLPSRRFVCVGRLCEQKGQLLLLEAARRLADETEYELVLVGDGELRGQIEAFISHFNLRNNVRVTGWVSNDRVREEIHLARALILPSFAEGLPVVLMESMALRRPVISTYIAGIPELVCQNENGWLVPAGDVEELVGAMRACLDAPNEVLIKMGQAARQRVLARHDVNREAKKLIELISQTADHGSDR
jgi:colanic acid/amylovoran biosynthesis glycosyltransferase